MRAKARKAAAVVISKKVIGSAAVRRLALLEEIDQPLLLDQPAGEADALVEADEMGRGVDMHRSARRLEDRPQIGQDRALAVGAGDMDRGRRLALGVAERGQQPLDATQRQVDDLGVKARQPFQDGVAVRGRRPEVAAGHGHRRMAPAAGSRAPPPASGCATGTAA